MTASGQNVENASGTKSLTKDTNWQLTCIFRDEFSSVLKESSLFADLTQVLWVFAGNDVDQAPSATGSCTDQVSHCLGSQ